MSRDIAADLGQQFIQMNFKDPRITYGYNCVSFRQHMSLFQKIYIAIGMLSIIAVFLWFHFPLHYLILFLAIPVAGIIFEYSEHFNVKEIDFMNKELRIKSNLPFVDLVRRKMKRKLIIPFSDIAGFILEEGKFSLYRERRTQLLASSFDHSPVTIASFRFERDARRVGELLQFYVTGNPNK